MVFLGSFFFIIVVCLNRVLRAKSRTECVKNTDVNKICLARGLRLNKYKRVQESKTQKLQKLLSTPILMLFIG